MKPNSHFSRREPKLSSIGPIDRYVLGHKLNNLLTPVMGMSYVLSKKAASCGDPSAERLATTIHDAAQAASRLLSMFIQVCDIQAGSREPSKRPGDISLLLDSVLHNLASEIHDAGAEVDLAADRPCRIMMDYDLLPDVLRYLIIGALDHVAAEPTPPPRRLEIQLQRITSQILVTIRYGSAPVSPEHLDRFFDPLGAGETGKGGRTGLEHAYAQAVVEAHGGSVSVLNVPLGGVAVRVVLPGEEGADTSTSAEIRGRATKGHDL